MRGKSRQRDSQKDGKGRKMAKRARAKRAKEQREEQRGGRTLHGVREDAQGRRGEHGEKVEIHRLARVRVRVVVARLPRGAVHLDPRLAAPGAVDVRRKGVQQVQH